jgi:purine-nucleoside/S-methyl-5'-thioadenosine phosphorylase / adenosine deaminase
VVAPLLLPELAPLLVQSPLLASAPGVRHGFTTRAGGVSVGPLASLNLARRPGETDAGLVENWSRVSRALGLEPGRLALMSQVHGAAVIRAAEASGPLAVLGEADALITTVPGLLLATRAADCVPILLAAPGAVAAVHSGWRGTVANVVGAATRALCEVAGCAPSAIRAAVGPCISGPAYECGPEVAQALGESGLSTEDFLEEGCGPREHVDLGRAVLAQLRDLGVRERERIEVCTQSDSRFFSHRGEGASTGRFAGVIALGGCSSGSSSAT